MRKQNKKQKVKQLPPCHTLLSVKARLDMSSRKGKLAVSINQTQVRLRMSEAMSENYKAPSLELFRLNSVNVNHFWATQR